jgi:hypothetical protein
MEQQRAPARLIGEGFPLGAADLSLNAIPMKPFAQGIETRPKIHPMEGIGISRIEVLVKCETRISRTHFNIFMSFAYSQGLGVSTKRPELFGIFNERLTVIGKGQRHKSVAGQPTANDTKQ